MGHCCKHGSNGNTSCENDGDLTAKNESDRVACAAHFPHRHDFRSPQANGHGDMTRVIMTRVTSDTRAIAASR